MIAATDGDTNQAGFAGGRKRCVQVATQGHVYTTSVQHDDIFLVLLHVLPSITLSGDFTNLIIVYVHLTSLIIV